VVTPLDAQAVAEERAKFLGQGEKFRAAVSRPKDRRHKEWINNLILVFRRKEHSLMLNTLIAIVVTITLVFGGGGVTVYAAQGSLPDEPLYAVKTWSEDTRLALAGSSQEKLDLTLDFTNRRVEEMTRLQAGGKAIPGGVSVRMQNELEEALKIAAGMEDAQMIQALEQVRLQAETHSQAVAAVMGDNPELARLQERLQEQVQLAAGGASDPQGFRLRVRERERQNNPAQTPNPTGSPNLTHTPPATPQPTGTSYGPGPNGNQHTGTPGHYGPGEPNTSRTPVPTGGSYGPGPGSGQPSTTPGGYGPGPHAGTSTCTPQGTGQPGNGANPSQTPGAGGPGNGSGDGSPNPSVTPQPGGPEQGGGQPTEAPGQGGDNGGGRP
jgi:hypothetical protein